MHMKNQVNKRVLELKTLLGLKDAEFVVKAGISPSSFVNISKDVPVTNKVIEPIMKAFNVNPEWLRDGKNVEKFLAPQKAPEALWKDEAYNNLKEEVKYYRGLLSQITGAKGNFPPALSKIGSRGGAKIIDLYGPNELLRKASSLEN